MRQDLSAQVNGASLAQITTLTFFEIDKFIVSLKDFGRVAYIRPLRQRSADCIARWLTILIVCLVLILLLSRHWKSRSCQGSRQSPASPPDAKIVLFSTLPIWSHQVVFVLLKMGTEPNSRENFRKHVVRMGG